MSCRVSIEVSPRCNVEKVIRVYESLNAFEVFVNWRPDESISQFTDSCCTLSQAGLKVVPHMVARNLRKTDEYQELIYRFNREGQIDTLMLLGGDADRVSGPYRCASDLLVDDYLCDSNIKKIYFAGYPQGHACIPQAELDSCLGEKIQYTNRLGINAEVVTQLCPSIEEMIKWVLKNTTTYNLNVRVSIPFGQKEIIKRRLDRIYKNSTNIHNKNFTIGTLAYLESVYVRMKSYNIKSSIHMIPFHDLEILLNQSKAINTMLQSGLS